MSDVNIRLDSSELEKLSEKVMGDADCKDKDLHRFELLKGQVLAGNNAKEIVDELKVLIVKLMNEDRINRKQGQNLLTDLVSLGF